MIRAMGITHDHKVETGIPLESIGDSKYGWSWVDFNEASAEEAEQLDHFFIFIRWQLRIASMYCSDRRSITMRVMNFSSFMPWIPKP